MEGLKEKKTAYLETLDKLYQELTQACSISLGGRKFALMGLLYDVHRAHQFFKQVKTNPSYAMDVQNVLKYDADVDYKQWCVKLDIKFDVTPFYIPDEKEDASAKALVAALNEQIVKLRERLLDIHTGIGRHRITMEEAKALYNHEYQRFVQEQESEVVNDFKKWKDQFDDDDELVRRNIKGKYHTEMLRFFQSGFLKPRISAQVETDTSCFDAEMANLHFKHIPSGMDVKLYYSALREFFDYKDQSVIPKKNSIGKYFYKYRKEVNDRQRAAYFRFVKMLSLIEEEKKPKPVKEELNYEGIKIAMARTYFPKCARVLNKDYNAGWLADYMSALMDSELREKLARDWAVPNKRDTIVCLIIGALKEAGVLKGSYSDIAKLLNEENARTLAKYAGQAKKHALADWTKEYMESR